jgi:N-acetylmuramoyl-L-alanine amidase
MTSFNDPEHWRNRAERARSLADQMNDEAFKQMMLRTAADYDRLAERVALAAQKAHRQQAD